MKNIQNSGKMKVKTLKNLSKWLITVQNGKSKSPYLQSFEFTGITAEDLASVNSDVLNTWI